MKVPLTKPLLGESEIEALKRPIQSGWVTQGPEVAAFEKEFSDFVGAQHACAVSSCTTALHLALLAVGIKAQDEVITASHSYIATANSIRYCNAIPVFADIQPDTFNMDPAKIEKLITKKTRAILCVHQMGMPCDLQAILKIAQKHSIPVIEDAACAIGGEILWENNWEKIGKPHGDIACFSFHPRKIITTGDGGMMTTSNREWDGQFRRLRQHGMSIADTVRHEAKEVTFESYPHLGYNYRMTDIQASVGREQMKRLSEIIKKRRELAARYHQLLADIPGLQLPKEPEGVRTNWQSFCIRLPKGSNQRSIMQFMLNQEIATRPGIMCAHKEGTYQTEPWSGGSLEESERAQSECILLPLYPQMTEAEQNLVAETLSHACKETIL